MMIFGLRNTLLLFSHHYQTPCIIRGGGSINRGVGQSTSEIRTQSELIGNLTPTKRQLVQNANTRNLITYFEDMP